MSENPPEAKPEKKPEAKPEKKPELLDMAKFLIMGFMWLPFATLTIIIVHNFLQGDDSRPEFLPIMVISCFFLLGALILAMINTKSAHEGRMRLGLILSSYMILTLGILLISGSNFSNYKCG